MADFVSELANERPTIEEAVKNYASMIIAASCTAADGSSSASAVQSMADVQQSARILLRGVNAFDLPPSPVWSEAHPQGDSQSGMDRLNEVARYNAASALASRAAGRRTKLLGKSWLSLIWEDLRRQLLTSPGANGTLEIFVAGFGESLFDGADADIVWAPDYRVALKERYDRRVKAAAERAERLQTTGTDEALQTVKAFLEANRTSQCESDGAAQQPPGEAASSSSAKVLQE